MTSPITVLQASLLEKLSVYTVAPKSKPLSVIIIKSY